MSKQSLTIGWLYPELMSTYGDRGNIICLTRRCQWRGIEVFVTRINFETKQKDIEQCDLIIGGGAQDRQQSLAVKDLHDKKAGTLRSLFDKGVPGLFVCGAPQLLGKWYMKGDGEKLPGLGIFDYVTRHFGLDKPRCIGTSVGRLLDSAEYGSVPKTIVGFENHGGRTYLSKDAKAFANVLSGYGNNGEDGTEGAVYKNVIACYYHGPLLPKNPHVADWLIRKALAVKYGHTINLAPLDDELEWKAHSYILNKLGLK